jgi:UDP-N-acetylmuramoyl-L-alanyl-D-glutamate--2,6-diaminopimelate ligase
MTAQIVSPLTTTTEELAHFLESHPATQAAAASVRAFFQAKLRPGNRHEIPISWDTRDVTAGANRKAHAEQPCLFFAIRGRTFDPSTLLPNIRSAGHVVIAQKEAAKFADDPSIPSKGLGLLIEVADPYALLADFCQHKLKGWAHHLQTYGVTGTNGKTSVTHILAHILRGNGERLVAQLGTLGFYDGSDWYPNTFPTTPGLPDITKIVGHLVKKGIRTLVLEVSSHALAEKRLGGWELDVAMLTNITPDHLDFHLTMEAYTAAKLSIFSNHLKPNGHAIVCSEKSPWTAVLATLNPQASFCVVSQSPLAQASWQSLRDAPGRKAPHTALLAHPDMSPDSTKHGLQFAVSVVSADTPKSGCKADDTTNQVFRVPHLCGDFQLQNVLVCVAAAYATGRSFDAINSALLSAPPVPGRMERIGSQQDTGTPSIFVDYAHTADALLQALQSLKGMRTSPTSQIWVVFGCGGDRDTSKRPEMGRVAWSQADQLIITSDNPRTEDPLQIMSQILSGIADPSQVLTEPDRARAIERAVLAADPDDLVLIAGKGHEDYQIIGSSKIHFSDSEQAYSALEKRKESKCSTP